MKIKQLRIEGFGKLVNQTYDLEDFTTFLGENEAGKSTILAFIKYMLFGFENATTSNQEFNPLNFKTYGGQIFLTHNNKSIRIERLKILRSGRPSFVCEINEGNQVTMLD
ncbi:MAG: ATP-binding protein, partial [Pseudolactococcus raffinolactis]